MLNRIILVRFALVIYTIVFLILILFKLILYIVWFDTLKKNIALKNYNNDISNT